MCGRYGLIASPEQLELRYGRQVKGEYQLSTDIRPTQKEPVITLEEPSVVQPMHWGFYQTIQGKPILTLNSRDDKLRSNWIYKQALPKYRCLIPAQEFYEWKVVDETNPKKPVKKQMTFKTNSEIFSFAGHYWTFDHPKTGEKMRGYSIITTSPNTLVADVHDRMPVILPKEVEELWLDPATSLDTVLELVKSFPAEHMICMPYLGQ